MEGGGNTSVRCPMESFHIRASRKLGCSFEYMPKMGRNSGLVKRAVTFIVTLTSVVDTYSSVLGQICICCC